jgi:hypothetical protein
LSAAPGTRPTLQALKLVAADRRGSSWPIVVETASGRWLVKLRGAAQGTGALVAEMIVADLARALDLATPGQAFLRVEPDLPVDDSNRDLRHGELWDLIRRSAGVSLGFQLLAAARDLVPADIAGLDRALASRIVWLDGLVMNPDRTARNPNLLIHGGHPVLIDHGAALSFQHDWEAVTENAPRRANLPGHLPHVLATRASLVADLDASLAGRITRPLLEAAAAAVPDDFLAPLLPAPTPAAIERRRHAYVAFLWKRLRAPRPFV